MKEAVIAIIFDFDETLGSDSTTFLLEKHQIAYDAFWPQVYKMVQDGWDPPLAYMQLLLGLAKQGKIDLSQKALQQIGKSLPLFDGIPDVFDELQAFVRSEKVLRKARVKLEYYIISGGMEEVIRGSSVAKYMTGIFGGSYAYEEKKKAPYAVKTAISFTEKTRFLYGINKGIGVAELRQKPYRINDAISLEQRRIPFSQMIYIGDGPSDIPALSTITHHGGLGIGVSSPHKTFAKGYELARGKRITVGPYTANYKSNSDMRKVLEESILRIGLEIAVNQQKHVIGAPRVG